MSFFNQKLILGLLFIILSFANADAQEALPTGSIVHESIDFPLIPVISTVGVELDDVNYIQVEFESEDVLNEYYESIDVIPPDFITQMRYFWTFGDGHISYESNPTHHYAISGAYEVTLQATPIYSPKPPPPLMKMTVIAPGLLEGEVDVSSTAGELPWHSGRLALKAEMVRNFRSNFESSMIITYENNSTIPDDMVNDVIQVYYDSGKVDAVAAYSFQNDTVTSDGEIMTNSILTSELDTDDHKMLTIPFADLKSGEARRIMIQFVSNDPSVTFDPEIFFGVNFQMENLSVVPVLQSSLRKSWDPNAKEAFEDYISPDDIPNTVKYRIYMENIGSESTYQIAVLDKVHSVLNIDPDGHAIVASKDDEVIWNYEPNFDDYNVDYFAPDFNLSGQTPGSNIEDSKFWFDVVYELDQARLQEKISLNNGYCREGVYSFGRNARITFDENEPIYTNTPIIRVGCKETDLEHCIAIKRISPNPVENVGTLVYKIEETLEEPLDVFAVSKFGKVTLIASDLSAHSGVHKYTLDFSSLKPDIYQLVISNRYCSAKFKGFVKK